MLHTTDLQRLRETGVHSFSAGDLAGRLARVLTSPSKQRRDQSRGHAETALVNALANEGCPVCRTNADHDDRYFFWFLHENYSQIEVIERLIRSLGFCMAHGG
jgi:hypothetical protein